MIKTTLPIQTKTIENGKLVVSKGEMSVAVDMSVFAEQRWQTNFPTNAANETVFAYIERIQAQKLTNTANVLSNLKAVYCFLESDEIGDFKSFCQLFDLSDSEYLQELTKKIKQIFELVMSGSAVTSKN